MALAMMMICLSPNVLSAFKIFLLPVPTRPGTRTFLQVPDPSRPEVKNPYPSDPDHAPFASNVTHIFAIYYGGVGGEEGGKITEKFYPGFPFKVWLEVGSTLPELFLRLLLVSGGKKNKKNEAFYATGLRKWGPSQNLFHSSKFWLS